MLIRKLEQNDIDKIVEMWYDISIKAHAFIPSNYWEKNKTAMANEYLPNSETYIAENGNEILGFIAMVDDNLAAIFVRTDCQAKGIGSELINFIKTQREKIQLKVYKKNVNSIQFYKKHGFKALSENIENETNEIEFIMEWKK